VEADCLFVLAILLGGPIPHCPTREHRLSPILIKTPGDPEVRDFRHVPFSQQDVLGLQVQVDNCFLVQAGDGVRQTLEEACHPEFRTWFRLPGPLGNNMVGSTRRLNLAALLFRRRVSRFHAPAAAGD
jgi:hypothetical protein